MLFSCKTEPKCNLSIFIYSGQYEKENREPNVPAVNGDRYSILLHNEKDAFDFCNNYKDCIVILKTCDENYKITFFPNLDKFFNE